MLFFPLPTRSGSDINNGDNNNQKLNIFKHKPHPHFPSSSNAYLDKSGSQLNKVTWIIIHINLYNFITRSN